MGRGREWLVALLGVIAVVSVASAYDSNVRVEHAETQLVNVSSQYNMAQQENSLLVDSIQTLLDLGPDTVELEVKIPVVVVDTAQVRYLHELKTLNDSLEQKLHQASNSYSDLQSLTDRVVLDLRTDNNRRLNDMATAFDLERSSLHGEITAAKLEANTAWLAYEQKQASWTERAFFALWGGMVGYIVGTHTADVDERVIYEYVVEEVPIYIPCKKKHCR